VTDQLQNKSSKQAAEIKMIGGAVHTLISNLGTSVELDDRFEAPTVWGAVAFIADKVARAGKSLNLVEGDLIPTSENQKNSSRPGFGLYLDQIHI
jgi:hypothetical protein